jgi:hypothetical protein
VAAPLRTGDAVSHLLVVGDAAAGDHEDTLRDVEVLAEAMSDALTRIGA